MKEPKHCFDCFNLRLNVRVKGKTLATAKFTARNSHMWCRAGVLKKGKRIPYRDDSYKNKMFLIANECEDYDDDENRN